LFINDWEQIERKEHDIHYRNSLPFDFKTYVIDPRHVIWWQDYCFKAGRRSDRGHRTKRVFEIVNLKTLKDKVILDVGCGNGQYSVFFALLGAIVYGFDISPAGISVANKLARANKVKDMCHFSVQNASSISYPNDSFDIVIFHEVLHHATKYPNVKEEVLRVVKKGGMVICAETLRGNIFFKLGRFFTTRKIKTKGDVELSLSDMESFARGFSEYKIEMMSFLFMIKRVFVKHLNLPLVRWFLLIVKRLDDVILGIFPFLNRYCGECILILKK